MVLILGATLRQRDAPGRARRCCRSSTFLGTPAIALTIAVLLAMYLLGTRRGMAADEMAKLTGCVAAGRSA